MESSRPGQSLRREPLSQARRMLLENVWAFELDDNSRRSPFTCEDAGQVSGRTYCGRPLNNGIYPIRDTDLLKNSSEVWAGGRCRRRARS
jgi:hypothetical protein